MGDERARRDANAIPTQLGVTDKDEIRKIRTTDKGKVQVDTGAGLIEDSLKVIDEHNHLLKEILVELKINNQYLSQITGDKVKESDIEK